MFVLLTIEYSFFKKQNEKIVQLKRDYREYVRSYKKLLLDVAIDNSQEDLDDCGKTDDSSDAMWLNRNFEYLKGSAVAYAKQFVKDENAFLQLYEGPWVLSSEFNHGQKAKKKPLAKKITQRSRIYSQSSASLFKWPIEQNKFWISSKFGPRKKSNGAWGYHYGLDMASLKGTPVVASHGGVVIEVEHSSTGYGNTVVLSHKGGEYTTRYAHLDTIAVKKGQTVLTSKLIGTVGDTGFVRGKNQSRNAHHLHFEVKQGGKKIDPLLVLL